jgi:lipid II:glycine glycyltransferase (peptidoglycan interpeptide bridge formation enzyme)
MNSGWFWRTGFWETYQREYYAGRPRPEQYKSSPLAPDHEFEWDIQRTDFDLTTHKTRVLDLTQSLEDLWRDIRKSYRPLINKAMQEYTFSPGTIEEFHTLHALANGRETRSQATWDCMAAWVARGYAGVVTACKDGLPVAGALFIIYQGSAYYASGASVRDNVQHAIIWTGIKHLKASGVHDLELGQVDGETEKERSIGTFKSGFGGENKPFLIVTRRTT